MKEKLKVVTTFSGVGMQERGIENSGCFDMEVIGTSDIDKNAILSYAAMHNGLTPELVKEYKEYPTKEEMVKELFEKNIGYDFIKKKAYDWNRVARKKDDTELKKYWLAVHLSKNMGDISKVKRLPKSDMLTFSFPCTDISIAGRQKGVSYEDWKNGDSTRSGLVWEIIRLLKVAKENDELPSYLLMENVAALVSKKFIHEFENLNNLLDEIGYHVYYQILNAKNTGVPQSRQRVFGIYIRKDIDKHKFTFPVPFDNGVRLKDILEKDVNVKYYFSQQIQDRFQLTDKSFTKNIIGTTKPDFRTIGQRDLVYQTNGVMGALIASDYKQPKQILVSSPNEIHMVGKLNIKGMDTIKRVYATDGVAPSLTTMQGGNRQPKIIEKESQKKKKEIKEIANGNKLLNMILSKNEIEDKECCDMTLADPQVRDIANCITARYDNGVSKRYRQSGVAVIEKEQDEEYFYIRKLTPTECFLLMGLTKEDVDACYAMKLSDGSLYKQAGNGIVANCIELLMQHLYQAQYDDTYICKDQKY